MFTKIGGKQRQVSCGKGLKNWFVNQAKKLKRTNIEIMINITVIILMNKIKIN